MLAFLAALLVAVLATAGVYRLLDGAVSADPADAMRDVVVAARDLPPGSALDASAVAVMRWPTRSVPSRAYAHADSVIGRVVRGTVVRGEPVLAGHLGPRGADAGIGAAIAPGRRAMAIRVSEAAGLSGLVRPDAQVDVVVTLRDDEAAGRTMARLLMSDVRVLTVGIPADSGAARPMATSAPIVTLEVTPAQAEQLAVAESQGTIQLVLRGYGSADRPETQGATTRALLGRAPSAGDQADMAPAFSRVADDLRVAATPAHAAPPRASAGSTVSPSGPSGPSGPSAPGVAADDRPTVRIYRGSQVETQRVDAAPRAAPNGAPAASAEVRP